MVEVAEEGLSPVAEVVREEEVHHEEEHVVVIKAVAVVTKRRSSFLGKLISLFQSKSDFGLHIFSDEGIVPAPDGPVLEIENTYMKNASGISALANLGFGNTMPLRPGYGTAGRRCLVWANSYKVSIKPNLNLWRYHVDVLPVKPLKPGDKGPTGGKLQQLISLLLDEPEFAGVATEYKALLVSAKKLNIPDDYQIVIKYRAEGQDEPRENAEEFTIRVVSPTILDVHGFVNYLSSQTPLPNYQQRLEVVQSLNALLGFYPRSRPDVVSIGQARHFLLDHSQANFHNIANLGGGIEALRGFVQSVRPATGGLLVNVNTTHGVFLEPRPMPWLINAMGSKDKAALKKKLKGKRMESTHLPVKISAKTKQPIPRVKTFHDFARPGDGKPPHPSIVSTYGAGPKNVQFWYEERTDAKAALSAKGKGKKKPAGAGSSTAGSSSTGPSGAGGRYITVWDYFRDRKLVDIFLVLVSLTNHLEYPNVKLDPVHPVINVGSNENPNYLPADVCIMLPGQVVKRRLSPEETQNMIKFACRNPEQNGRSITNDGTLTLGLRPSVNKGLVC